jgi:predicted transcriptional regulator
VSLPSRVAVFLVLVALVPECVGAATSAVDLTASRLDGLRSVEQAVTWSVEMTLPDDAEDVTFLLEVEDLDGTLFTRTENYIRTPFGRITDGNGNTHPRRLRLQNATLHDIAADASFLIRLPTSEPVDVPATLVGGWSAATPEPSEFRLFPTIDAADPATGIGAPAHRSYQTDGGRIRSSGLGIESYGGPIEFFAWSAELSGDNGRGRRESFASGSSATDEVGGLDGPREVHVYHHFVGTARGLSVSADGRPIAYWTKEATLVGPMDLLATDADGRIVSGAANVPFESALVRVAGENMALSMVAPAAGLGHSMAVHAEGTFDHMSVDGKQIALGPGDGASGATAAAGMTVAALLAALVAGAFHFKFATFFPAFAKQRPGRERLKGAPDALENKTRKRIHRLIAERPGVQPFHVWKQIGGAFGVTLRGLELLERVGLVRSVKQGKNRHYYRNTPEFTPRITEVLAVLARRNLAQTFQTLRDRGPMTQKELSNDLRVGVPTLSVRLSKLSRYGLVVCERRGGRKHYRVVEQERLPISWLQPGFSPMGATTLPGAPPSVPAGATAQPALHADGIEPPRRIMS